MTRQVSPAMPSASQSRRALIAGSVGNFIEWYEFGVYGYLATIIAGNFFTLEGQTGMTGLLLTYASFALAFSAVRLARSFLVASVTALAASRH